ncbi:MAG: GGDEF domain-containing protein [Armatimonadota bacterium]|nr:GGDEF domain-containing protein [Armatimonadota bacterium]
MQLFLAMVRNAQLPDSEARRRRAQARGILISALGYATALGVIELTARLWHSPLSPSVMAKLAAVTAAVLAGLYLMAATGATRAVRSWDPHFVYLPLLVTVVLLNLYMRAVPDARWVLVHGWLGSLGLVAGFGAVWPLLGLTALYLATYLWVASGSPGFYLRQELVVIFAVAFASVMCSVASERFRRQRERSKQLARQLEEANRRLADLALRDPLTGVHNRRYLEEFLAQQLARAQRQHTPVLVAMVDLDDFKLYNDTQGHLAGDEVLRRVADAMRCCVRRSDLVARYGGEEFTVVLVDTNPHDGARVLERIRSAVASLPLPGAELLPWGSVTVSLGAACYPEDGFTAQELLTRADDALYRAKTLGKNRVEFARAPGPTTTSVPEGTRLAPDLARG